MEKEFFEEIERFFQLQEKQRQRGLNNYNLLTAVLSPSDEVRLHSRMLYSLLDPNGLHFQGNLFLKSFIKALKLDDFEINLDACVVKKEYENIDLYITDGSKQVIIENKIHAGDQEKQIQRYVEIIEKGDKTLKADDLVVVYLSLDRKEPSAYSLGNLKVQSGKLVKGSEDKSHFRSIFYNKEIMGWLEECKHEVQNITNLNHAIEQYMEVVRMINNEYKGKAISLSDYLKNHKEFYSMAMQVSKAMPKVREDIANDFFQLVVDDLREKLKLNNDDWVVEIKGDLSTAYSFPIRLYKKSWNKTNSLIIGFEFEHKDFHDCILGIARRNKEIKIKKGIDSAFKVQLGKLDKTLKTTQWWLHWEWFQKGDFIDYILKNEDVAKDSLVNKLYEQAEIFEIDSHLLSDINNYLVKH